MTKRIAVIGGGIGGLAVAWRLREAAARRGEPVAITIYEAGDRWGGVIGSSTEGGYTLEHGPDSLLRTKPAGLRLIADLGLADAVQDTAPEARRALISRGKNLNPVPEGLYLMAPGKLWPFALSPILSWRGKLRLALDLVLPRRDPLAEEESLADFVRRRLGREALERIAQPMVSGIYTADPEQLSVAATMPQFLEMERDHRSLVLAMRKRSRAQGAAAAAGPRYGLFASLRGGLQTLVDRLVERLAGCELRLNSPVSAVVRLEKCFTLALLEDYVEADLVVIATPAHAAAPLCRTLDQILAFTLVTIPYAGVATVNLAFRREQLARLPAGAGFVVPEVESRAIVACSIASQKYDGRAPDHGVLLRAFVGGAQHEDRLEQDDETLVAGVLGDLRDLVGLEGEPRFARVHRHPKAMAQYHLGHREQVQVIRSYERQFPGLALVGNGYEGVGIPDIIAQADAAAARLMAEEKGRGARGEGREETSR